jgi:tetratricopeptide (TPR) repeat protein
VTGRELAREVADELRALQPETAERVARHLVMAGRLLDEDSAEAYAHAVAARRAAPRLAGTREALGLAAYADGRYAEALAELRAARRISGSSAQLPVMADCERGLGRPDRALALAASDEARRLDRVGQVEMRIVAAGARRDLGQLDAAVVTLQGPELSARAREPWTARLRYAYADALLAAGRLDEAAEWFSRAAEADVDGDTDAAERVAEIEGISFVDLLDEDEDTDELKDTVDNEAGHDDDATPATGADNATTPTAAGGVMTVGDRALDVATSAPLDAGAGPPNDGAAARSATPIEPPAVRFSDSRGETGTQPARDPGGPAALGG